MGLRIINLFREKCAAATSSEMDACASDYVAELLKDRATAAQRLASDIKEAQKTISCLGDFKDVKLQPQNQFERIAQLPETMQQVMCEILGTPFASKDEQRIKALKYFVAAIKREADICGIRPTSGEKQGAGTQGNTAEPLSQTNGARQQDSTKKPTETKQMPHFDSNKSNEELKYIFEQLQEEGLIGKDSKLCDWLYICKGGGPKASKGKIKWTAKNTRTKGPSKKSLLDLLVTMGFQEKSIRANINECFEVEKAAKKYTAQDYQRYRDWSKDIESEYHGQITEIVNKENKSK